MANRILKLLFATLGVLLFGNEPTPAATYFVEAEAFQVKGNGWKPFPAGGQPEVGAASGTTTLWGGDGPGDSVATTQIQVSTPGKYRLWVRYMESPYRGPFTVRVRQKGQDAATQNFDIQTRADVAPWTFAWSPLDNVQLLPGTVTIQLEKYQGQAANCFARHVDCFLLTNNLQATPDYVPYGPQTWMRVTLAPIYKTPVYIGIFADHFRDPYYANYSISKAGLEKSQQPARTDSLLKGGESTGWINISGMVYQDSGALLMTSICETCLKGPPELKAKFDFATSPAESAIVKTFDRDATFEDGAWSGQPSCINIIVPPNLIKKENIPWLMMDLDLARKTGKMADNFPWPVIGKRPATYSFLVYEDIHSFYPHDKELIAREEKTLGYFDFNRTKQMIYPRTWCTKNNSYDQPDISAMTAAARASVADSAKSGKKTKDIAWGMLTDEPLGPTLDQLVKDPASHSAFRQWLQDLKVPLSDLQVADWKAVKPVAQGKENPALFYYSQKYRTYSLGKFMALQRQILREAYGQDIPNGPNFSDGATVNANFYTMGYDYFDLLDSDALNGLWSEDWGDNSVGGQCSTYNVELMRSAALGHAVTLGQYLIAYSQRTSWDIDLNAVSQAGRDIKVLSSFWYGPSWANHLGGPPWNCTGLYSQPGLWRSNAELTRQFGGAEDLLLSAKKAPSPVGIIYSSSADIWTEGRTNAYGFDRMFTWLALTHGQIPVDFVSEKRVAQDDLAPYRVLYLSGPNLSRSAAQQLVGWVKKGGILVLSAAAASRDEFNRPMTIVDEILPAGRSEIQEPEPFATSGGFITSLHSLDSVATTDQRTRLDVLSVKQALSPKPGSQILATNADKSAAYLTASMGAGRVYQTGFLPGLAYIYPALLAREKLEADAGKTAAHAIPDPSKIVASNSLLLRSKFPWQYPDAVRELIAGPVILARTPLPITCNVPLVDAVLMEGERGAVVPLANYTLQPLAKVTLTVNTAKTVARIESVHRGTISFTRKSSHRVEFTLPLQETDFILLHYEDKTDSWPLSARNETSSKMGMDVDR